MSVPRAEIARASDIAIATLGHIRVDRPILGTSGSSHENGDEHDDRRFSQIHHQSSLLVLATSQGSCRMSRVTKSPKYKKHKEEDRNDDNHAHQRRQRRQR